MEQRGHLRYGMKELPNPPPLLGNHEKGEEATEPRR
jgi:hypothetical protein